MAASNNRNTAAMAFPDVFVSAIIGDGAAQDKGRAACRRYRFNPGLIRASS
jgi:hypothetical protein